MTHALELASFQLIEVFAVGFSSFLQITTLKTSIVVVV
jgi:hypothetical protein